MAVEGVTASPALLAWLLYQKYALHLLLYRQEDAYHGGPFRSWRYLFIDRMTIPHVVAPLILHVNGGWSGGRTCQEQLEPQFKVC